MTDEAKGALVHELARPMVRSWWTVVAGVCLGLAAALLTLGYLRGAGVEVPGKLETGLLGVVIGLIVFAGPPLIRSAVSPFICSEDAIRALTDVPVIGAIPRIRTRETATEARRRLALNILLCVPAVGALLAVVLLGPG